MVVILAALPANARGIMVTVILVQLVLVQLRPVGLVVAQLLVYIVALPVAVAVAVPQPAAVHDGFVTAAVLIPSLLETITVGDVHRQVLLFLTLCSGA